MDASAPAEASFFGQIGIDLLDGKGWDDRGIELNESQSV
jgi:hypothetical protein